MVTKRRQFEPESAEDLCRSAIFIKYTVRCSLTESIQPINRDDVAICRTIGGRDWVVTTDYQKSLIGKTRSHYVVKHPFHHWISTNRSLSGYFRGVTAGVPGLFASSTASQVSELS